MVNMKNVLSLPLIHASFRLINIAEENKDNRAVTLTVGITLIILPLIFTVLYFAIPQDFGMHALIAEQVKAIHASTAQTSFNGMTSFMK